MFLAIELLGRDADDYRQVHKYLASRRRDGLKQSNADTMRYVVRRFARQLRKREQRNGTQED